MSYIKFVAKGLKNVAKNTKAYNSTNIFTRGMKDIFLVDIPGVSASTLRGRLKGLEIKYDEAYNNFVIGCPICENKGESLTEKTKIFINKRTGAFTCESCKHTGSWLDMERYLKSCKGPDKIEKDPEVIKDLEKLGSYLRSIKKNCCPIQKLNEDTYTNLLTRFNLPIVPKSLFENLNVYVDITNSNIFFPLHNSSLDLVGYKVLKIKSTSVEPRLKNTESSGVIISKPIKRKKDVAVVVSNVADFLTLLNASLPFTIICLPNGLKELSIHILPCFEKYHKIVLWLGDDILAWDTARSYARKLGERRCSFIKSTDTVSLPHSNPSQNFLSAIAEASPVWHKSITTFANLREDVLSDLKNMDKVHGVKWTRFPTLNKVLKGHRAGELTVFTGPTGCGKTTFISEYSLDLAMQGVNTLWGSFEIRNVRLLRTMLTQLAGKQLDQHIEEYDFWADKFEELPLYYMTFHGQQTIKVVMEAIEHATYVHDISHVIIDNLQFMMGMSEDSKYNDRFWKQDLIIANFRSFATRKNCHVTLVIHPRKERDDDDLTMSSIFGGAKASQESDNIMIIQDKKLLSVKGKKYLQIFKNRFSGDLGIMPLDFDKNSLSFVPKKKRVEDKKKRSDLVPEES